MNRHTFSKGFLLLLLFAVSALFLAMIRTFLLTLILAAVFSALAHPSFRRLERAFGGRTRTAAGTTLAVIFFAIILFLAMLGTLLVFLKGHR